MASMPARPWERLRAIAWSATCLAIVAIAHEVAWSWRAATAGSPDSMQFAVWQRPFVDGPSLTAVYITLAATVMVSLLPAASHLETLRRSATRLIALAAVANVVVGIGYVAAANTWAAPPHKLWTRESAVGIAVNELPVWGAAVVSLFFLYATRRESAQPVSTDESADDSYLVDSPRPRAGRRS